MTAADVTVDLVDRHGGRTTVPGSHVLHLDDALVVVELHQEAVAFDRRTGQAIDPDPWMLWELAPPSDPAPPVVDLDADLNAAAAAYALLEVTIALDSRHAWAYSLGMNDATQKVIQIIADYPSLEAARAALHGIRGQDGVYAARATGGSYETTDRYGRKVTVSSGRVQAFSEHFDGPLPDGCREVVLLPGMLERFVRAAAVDG